MFKRFLREVYLLPRGEQRALVFVSFLLILSVGLRMVVQILPEREAVGMEQFMKEAQAFLASVDSTDSLKKEPGDGIMPGQSPDSPTFDSGSFPGDPPLSFPVIDINRADSVSLLPLPGIGPVFAGRIIKYRDLLGGFVHPDQLREVYGLPVETLGLIRDRILIDTGAIRKLVLDTASFRDLLRHPYLDFEEVKALVSYREYKKHVSTLSELRTHQILSDTSLLRMGPYLDLKCERNPK